MSLRLMDIRYSLNSWFLMTSDHVRDIGDAKRRREGARGST